MIQYRPQIDSFSDGYYIFSDARVIEHSGDYTIIADDTYRYLSGITSEPLLKVGDTYHWPSGEFNVPPDVVAVPSRRASDEDEKVLVAKPKTRDELFPQRERDNRA